MVVSGQAVKRGNQYWLRLQRLLALLMAPALLLAAVLGLTVAPGGSLDLPEGGGDVFISVQTAADGTYLFDGIPQATHRLWLDVDTLPARLRPVAQVAPVRLTINPGQTLLSPPVGNNVRFTATYGEKTGQISGLVFHDANSDGRHQPGERRLAGVTVVDPSLFIYFVPGPYSELFTVYDAIKTCSNTPPLANVGMDYVISVTASADGTLVNYDHWEDGYDPDPLAAGPTSLSTTLAGGQSQVYLTEDAGTATPMNNPPSPFPYDGRDRITIFGEQVNVVVNNWPAEIGPLLAGSWSMRDASRWGTEFIIPAGEDLTVPPEDFEYTSLFIMAQAPDTVVTYDIDGPGPAPAHTVTLANLGDSHLIPGDPLGSGDPGGLFGVQSGATVSASAPVQLHLFAGACDGTYAGRGGYWIVPADRLDNEYYAPTPFFPGGGSCTTPPPGGDRDTELYLRNPGSTSLIVNWETNSASGTLSVPPATTVRYINGDADSGVHLWSNDPAAVFAVIASVDANNIDWDWGYELVPANRLTSQAVLGWSPGTVDLINNQTGQPPPDGFPDPPTGGGTPNGNLAFVVPITNATIFVDLDNDGTADDFDNTGDGLVNPGTGAGVLLNALDVLRVADPTDFDLNGAIVYSANFAERFSMVWGEDPCNAGRATPHFDGGFAVPPLPVLTLTKADQVSPAPVECSLSLGDVITYTVRAQNTGRGSMNNVVMTDTFDYTSTQFIVDSLAVLPPFLGPPFAQIEYDDGSGTFTYTPAGLPGELDPNVQTWRVRWPFVAAREIITTTFRVQLAALTSPFPDKIVNRALAEADGVLRVASSEVDDPFDRPTDTCLNLVDVGLTKDDGLAEVEPGQVVTYTMPYSNAGPTTALDVFLTDTLPVGVDYVSHDSTPPLPATILGSPPGVQFDVGLLAPGQGGMVTLTIQVAPSFTGTLITNTVVIATTSIDTNPANNQAQDVDQVVPPPTAVQLLYFIATPEGPDVVRLRWETAWELNNWGFKLYRGQPRSLFTQARVIATIPGQGTSLEATRYDYLDTGLAEAAYRYWLVDVDSHNGSETRHGPVDVFLAGSTFPDRVYLPLLMKKAD
jgi:uncharacterized repeat protein (TIGR01451 family)